MSEQSSTSFQSACRQYRDRAEQVLAKYLYNDPEQLSSDYSQRLHAAMRYSALNGGKRFRAMLVYACGEASGAKLDQLDLPAAAVEMIHAYSLIHDDLPAMDDDDLRRGKPTNHIQFDEATAILAGDALQTRAFEILSDSYENMLKPEVQTALIFELAKASGSLGMAGGQALDMEATGGCIENDQLVRIHRLKTGALIQAWPASGHPICEQVRPA